MSDKYDDGLYIDVGNTLSKKVSKGLLWVTAASLSTGGLHFVTAIFLTKLLGPSDFGLMAIAVAIISFIEGTTQTGFESALIQKQDRPETFLDAAWTFELVRYLILFLVIFFSAPLFAYFFKEPEAVTILRVIILSFIFKGLRNIGVIYFRRNLEFHKQFVMVVVPSAVYISVVIPLAFSLKNVWALVWATLLSSISACIISYLIHDYRPHIDFNIIKAKGLFGFGKWILGTSIGVMIKEQGLTVFIGKFLGIQMLGFYNRADTFSSLIFKQIGEIVWRVGYPAYSQIQTDRVALKNAYLKTLQLLSFIGIPIAGGLFVLGSDFVLLFLTENWLPTVAIIQILCLRGMLLFVNTPSSILFQACGRPSISTKISFLNLVILAILIYPASIWWGLTGTVTALFLSALLTTPVVWVITFKVIDCSFFEFTKPVFIPLINTVFMACAIVGVKHWFMKQPFAFGFFILLIIGLVVYFPLTYLCDRYFGYGIRSLLLQRFKAIIR